MVQIAPSMLAADFLHLEKDVEVVNEHADLFHLDIMDGVFVPNLSYGFPVVEAIAKIAKKPLDTHLMIIEPEKYVAQFAEAGADIVTFHYEATQTPREAIRLIRESGAKVGISIKPKTPVEVLRELLPEVDLVLIMSVEPGFGGQSFIEGSTDKVRELRKMIDEAGLDVTIEIDGGVSAANAGELYEAGCDALVAGSAVFKAADPEAEILKILNA